LETVTDDATGQTTTYDYDLVGNLARTCQPGVVVQRELTA
jgi:YD repeat-containing protein